MSMPSAASRGDPTLMMGRLTDLADQLLQVVRRIVREEVRS